MTDLKTVGPGSCDRRREIIVATAAEAFLRNGYAGTTMSSISLSLGGSKTTLWSYFGSKEELFEAVVDRIVSEFGNALSVSLPLDGEVREVLTRFGSVLLETLCSAPILALYRVVVGEAVRFPHLAAVFYGRGPLVGKSRLSAYLDQNMEAGRLRAGDPGRAAAQLVGLLQSGSYQEILLGIRPVPSERQRDEEVEAAVLTFLDAWRR